MKKEDLINILNTYPAGADIVVGLPVVGTHEMQLFGLLIQYESGSNAAIISPNEQRNNV